MIQKVISVALLVATVLGLINVYGDDSDTRRAAEKLVCGKDPCVRLIGAERTPISRRFTFQVQLSPPRTHSVTCRRTLLFVGEYQCQADP